MKNIIKSHKMLIVSTIFISIISSLLLVISSFMLANLLNIILDKNTELLFIKTVEVILISALALSSSYIKQILTAKTIEKMNTTLRKSIVEKITSMSYQEYNMQNTGTYVSWLSNDINHIESTAFANFFTFCTMLSTIIFSILGLLYIHYLAFISATILCFVMLYIPRIFEKKIQHLAKQSSNYQEEFTDLSKEVFMGYDVLYNYNLIKNISKKIINNSTILEDVRYKLKKVKALNYSLIVFANITAQIIMMFLSGYLIISGFTKMGSIIVVTDLSGTFFRSVSSLLESLTEIKSSKLILQKYTKNNYFNNKNCYLDSFNDCMVFENVSFSYDNKRAIIKNMNLKLIKGGKYAIIGESGSGKTTLIKLILGHLTNYTGEIYIDGKNIKDFNEKSINDKISYISQDVYVFNDSIKNNITLNEEFDKYSLQNCLKNSCLLEYVSSLDNDINTIITENGKNLSGGQKQRIAIARSLIRNKPILIIDEGTSALDKKNSTEVESMLLKNKNLTVILITHHLHSELYNKFDTIIDLNSKN